MVKYISKTEKFIEYEADRPIAVLVKRSTFHFLTRHTADSDLSDRRQTFLHPEIRPVSAENLCQNVLSVCNSTALSTIERTLIGMHSFVDRLKCFRSD
jgi:hypothetical protein